jgi:hypothetical protein
MSNRNKLTNKKNREKKDFKFLTDSNFYKRKIS